METAKSGRKYRKIPKGYDVETWDKMTPIERMKVLGLICNKYRKTSLNAKKYFHELSQEEIDEHIIQRKDWKYVMENYKQPSWCTYQEALSGQTLSV